MKAKDVKLSYDCSFRIMSTPENACCIAFKIKGEKYACYVDTAGPYTAKVVDADFLRWLRYALFDDERQIKRVIITVEAEVRLFIEEDVMEAILE